MTNRAAADDSPLLVAEWSFPASAALGSAVRVKGIEREIRARLPWGSRHGLAVEAGRVVLGMPETDRPAFEAAAAIVAGAVAGIGALPVLPGELEDILAIAPRERLKWTKDGRLKSAGTRTVKLRGRAKAVTFHVFDPREVEDVLDRDLPTLWREEDAKASGEARRRAAGKAALTRADKGAAKATRRAAPAAGSGAARPKLDGWDRFETEGFLR